MKNLIRVFLFLFAFPVLQSSAQFGYLKKSDMDKVKDARIIVVLFNDSSYNASITAAMERYWKFSGGFMFVHDSMLKQYNNKPEYIYLVFSKSKASKIKLKACLAEEDMNGLLLTYKFKRKVTTDIIIANGFCSNKIDTADWYPEMVRAVQMMNNYMDLAAMAESDKEMQFSYIASKYPTDKSTMESQTLYALKSEMGLQGKEDAAQLWGGDFEELMEKEEIYKLVLEQSSGALYFLGVKDAVYCNKFFISASGSELMYYTTTKATDACKCTAKDLKALKDLKLKASKEK